MKSSPLTLLFDKMDAFDEKLKKRQVELPMDLLGGCLLLAFSVVMLLLIPREIRIKESDVVNGRAFPSLLMIIMAACSLALIVKEVVKMATGKRVKRTVVNLLVEVRALTIFAIMLVYFFACQWTGNFAVGSCLFAVLMLLFFRCRKWSYYAIVLGAAVLIWAAFRFLLLVRF